MHLWIGTSGFQYPEWKGTFYPEKMPVSKMLPFYAERFASTEINYSFRRIPSPKTIMDWANATPDGFRFSFKAPQKVTHFARLNDCIETVEYFSSVISALGEKLGAVLFQLPPDFERDVPRLRSFVMRLPQHLRVAFEFRHPSWFDESVYSALREYNSALCLAESEKIATPPVDTANFGYLRLRREDYSTEDIQRWAELIRDHEGQWEEAFVYFKHEESGAGPKLAAQLMEALPKYQEQLVSV